MRMLGLITSLIFIIIGAIKGDWWVVGIATMWCITELMIFEANISLKKKKKHYDDEAIRLIKAVEREFKDEQK